MCAKANERGLTLVEVLVASVLLATGLAAAAGAFSMATRAQAAAARADMLARLAETKMAEIEILGTTSGSAEGVFAELDEEPADDASDLAEYNYRWEIASTDTEGLVRVEVSVWREGGSETPLVLVGYLPSAEDTTL